MASCRVPVLMVASALPGNSRAVQTLTHLFTGNIFLYFFSFRTINGDFFIFLFLVCSTLEMIYESRQIVFFFLCVSVLLMGK